MESKILSVKKCDFFDSHVFKMDAFSTHFIPDRMQSDNLTVVVDHFLLFNFISKIIGHGSKLFWKNKEKRLKSKRYCWWRITSVTEKLRILTPF